MLKELSISVEVTRSFLPFGENNELFTLSLTKIVNSEYTYFEFAFHI